MKEQKVDKGGKATKPADPTKEGYDFLGWYNGETEYKFTETVSADLTLKAKWEKYEVYVVLYQASSNVTYDVDTYYRVKTTEKHKLLGAADITVNSETKALTAWNVKPATAEDSAAGVQYPAGTEIEVKENLIVSPVLGAANTVSFHLDLGEDAVEANTQEDSEKPYVPQKIGDGGVVVEPKAPEKAGYTFQYWATVKAGATAGADPIVTKYDFSKTVNDDLQLYAVWAGADLEVVAYSEAEEIVNNTPVYDDAVIGLTIDKEAIVSGETNTIAVDVKALLTEGNDTEINKVPSVYIKAPKGATAAAVYAIDELPEEFDDSAEVDEVEGADEVDTISLDLDGMIIGGKAVPGVRLPITDEDLFLVQFTYGEDISPIYVVEFNVPKVAYIAVDVNLNVAEANAAIYKDSVKAANAVRIPYKKFVVLLPEDYVIEVPKAGSLIKTVPAVDGKTTTNLGISGLEVLDALNNPVDAGANGYAVAKGMQVTYKWGDTVRVEFDAGEAGGAAEGTPLMPDALVAQDSVYALPEPKFVAAEGMTFAGWSIKEGGDDFGGVGEVFPVGYQKKIGSKGLVLTATWEEGATITLSAGYGDDAGTEEVETTTKSFFFTTAQATAAGNKFTLPIEPDAEWGFKAPAGYKFGGWIDPDEHSVVESRTVDIETKTYTANWVPEITFEAADLTYAATVRGDNQKLTPAAYKTQVAAVVTAGEEDNSYVVTTKDDALVTLVPVAGDHPDPATGHFLLLNVKVPASDDVDLSALKINNQVVVFDTVAVDANNEDTSTKITLAVDLDELELDDDGIAEFEVDLNGYKETFTFDFSGVKIGWPVIFEYGALAEADPTVTADVVYFEDGATLSIPSEVAAKAVFTGHTLEGWAVDEETTAHDFDEDPVEVDDALTLTAQWTANKLDITVDLKGGAIDTEKYNGDNKTLNTYVAKKKIDYGTVIILPKVATDDVEIAKGGAVLVDWTVNGTTKKPGAKITVTEATTITANWASYLGTLDVAPLKDAAEEPVTTLYKADTYKVGTIETNEETLEEEFVELPADGKTGVAVIEDETQTVSVVLHAEELVKHANKKVYEPTSQGAATEAWWVGLKITAPADLGVVGYSLSDNIGEVVNKTSYAKYYNAVTIAEDADDSLNLYWAYYNDDGKLTLTPEVTYVVSSDVTKLFPAYTVKFAENTLQGFTADTHYVVDTTTGNAQNLNDQTNIEIGEEFAPIVIKSVAGATYWDEAEVTKLMAAAKLPATITAKVETDKDGLFNVLTISGTVGGTSDEITLPVLKTALKAKTQYTITAGKVTFEALDNTSGNLVNNTGATITAAVTNGTWQTIKNGEKGIFTGLTAAGTIYFKMVEDLTHTASAQSYVTVSKPDDINYEQSDVVPATIKGQFGYIELDPELTYEYRTTGGQWKAVKLTTLGLFAPEAEGTYDIRVAAKGSTLASNTIQGLQFSAAGAPAAVSVTFGDATPVTTNGNGLLSAGNVTDFGGDWYIDGTDIKVTVDENTVFTADTVLSKTAVA